MGPGGSAGLKAGELEDLEEDLGAEAVARMRPEVPEWLLWVWKAFHRLSAERSFQVSGMAAPLGATRIVSRPGRIPWTAVHRWARARGYDADRTDFLDSLIGEMDDEFIDWHGKQVRSR